MITPLPLPPARPMDRHKKGQICAFRNRDANHAAACPASLAVLHTKQNLLTCLKPPPKLSCAKKINGKLYLRLQTSFSILQNIGIHTSVYRQNVQSA
jgi:hypothetical protein